MHAISERIIARLRLYLNNRPESKDTLLDTLSISNSYGNHNVTRDRIIMEAGLLKYQLFGTTLFCYDYDTCKGYITTTGYHSQVTTTRVKDLLKILFTEVSVYYPNIYVSGMKFDYDKVFKFEYNHGAMIYIAD